MSRPVAFASVMLLSWQSAGAAQTPSVRGSAPLPVSARALALALGLPSADPSRLLLHVVRLVYDTPDAQTAQNRRVREALHTVLSAPGEATTDVVPLPLAPAIWRDTILQTSTSDDGLVSAILKDRRAALLYFGLAALDDETLGWLGSERDTLLHARKHAGLFAAFGQREGLALGDSRLICPPDVPGPQG